MEHSSADDSENDIEMKRHFESLDDGAEKDDDDDEKPKSKNRSVYSPEILRDKKEDDRPEVAKVQRALTTAELIKKFTETEEIKEDVDETAELDASAEDAAADFEELTDEETQYIADQYLDARHDDLTHERQTTEPGSTEEAQVLADDVLVSKVQEKVAEAKDAHRPVTEELIDDSLQEAVEELQVGQHTEEAAETVDPQQVEAQEVLTQASAESEDDDPNAAGTLHASTLHAQPSIPPSRPPQTPPVPPLTPPRPPVFAGGAGFAGGLPPMGGMPSPNVITPPAPEAKKTTDYERDPINTIAAAGAAYLIGRRRGRIKTEARMKPVQKELERKVKDLHQEIAVREDTIRTMTADKIRSAGEPAREKVVQVAESKTVAAEVVPWVDAVPHAEAVELPQPATVEAPAPETLAEESRWVAPEVVGITALSALERPQSERAEARSAPDLAKEAIQTMPTTEVLQIAQRIEVQGSTVKNLYEQGRLDQDSMRKVVQEYVQGGRHERILAEKLQPPRSSETHERLAGPAASQVAQDQGGGTSGGGAYAARTHHMLNQPAPTQSPSSADAAENRLAQDHLEAEQHKPIAPMAVAGAIVFILVFAALALLL